MSPSIEELATTSQLLVVSDFDGTLAGFSADPNDVPINAEAVDALRRLATLPATTVAILSGRHLDGLRSASGFGEDEFLLVGSHGAESSDHPVVLTSAQVTGLAQVEAKFEVLASAAEGMFVEHKPYHRVLHAIRAIAQGHEDDVEKAKRALDEALELSIPGVRLKPGKWIVEASVTEATKGTWIADYKAQNTPTATVFLGDDTTDEDGFRALGPDDLSVKVGDGDTEATWRVADIAGVGTLLAQLADRREAFMDR